MREVQAPCAQKAATVQFKRAWKLKALSVANPWAWAILFAGRRLENQRRSTGHRGPVLLYVSHYYDDAGTVPVRTIARANALLVPDLMAQPRGLFVASAILSDCVYVGGGADEPLDTSALPADQRRWATGPYCYLLEDVRRIVHIRAAERGGLFDVDEPLRLRYR